jgi:hypothetical protein
VASKLRFSGLAPESPALGSSSECVRVPSLSKRGVVAFRMRLLRSVVSECGRTPKDVLSGTFKNLRRTASTKKSMRMSRRFARTAYRAPFVGAFNGAALDEWTGEECSWRPIGDVALDVLKSAAVSAKAKSTRSV